MSFALDCFLRYVQMDTQSDENSAASPSTPGQFELARVVEKELCELGCENIRLSQHCCLFADLPATPGCEAAPALGLIAHFDTCEAASGRNVRPRIIRYAGKPVTLSEGRVLDPARFPALTPYVGDQLVVSDGTTLLGADDKAGMAEIMGAIHAIQTRNLPHGALRIGFTPDEEIGRGTEHFDVAGFNADLAYTVDGGEIDTINFENFNAAEATVCFTGISVHPGSAKGVMVNALHLAQKFDRMLPEETPATTEGHDGFYHLINLSGSTGFAEAHYLLRDHDAEKFAERKAVISRAACELNRICGYPAVETVITDQYRNMLEIIEQHPETVEIADEAIRETCGRVLHEPIRGGTDGAMLSFKGLPCPNLGTGGGNCHGEYEFLSIEAMDKMVSILLRIVELTSQKKRK